MKFFNTKLLFVVFILTLTSFLSFSQSYDFSITGVDISKPTGYSVGSSIPVGTALDELSFDIGNNGTNTIPMGTKVDVDLDIDGSITKLTGTLGAALAPSTQTTFTVDCRPSAINLSFPTTAGKFTICVTSTYANDPNKSNNKLCSQYTMTSSSSGVDLAVQIGSIEVTNPTGISQGGNIALGTALNQIQFIIENVGTQGLGSGSSFPIEIEVGGVKKTTTLTLSSNLLAKASTKITANCMSSGLNMDFPSSPGSFDICFRVTSSLDKNPNNNRHCQSYTMGSGTVPKVTSMSPTSGPIGTSVTIYGSNFATSGNTVRFSPNTYGTITSSTSNQIKVTVPTGTMTGPVELTTAGYRLNAGIFTVSSTTSHTITALSPNGGLIGAEIKIIGTNFDPNAANNIVTFFGGQNATVKKATPTELTVNVPSGAMTGPVAVRIGGITVMSAQSFTVFTTPTMVITDFNPKKAAIGQEVTIDGDLFSTTGTNTVTFSGGAVATIVSENAKKIVVKVPSGAIDGYFTVNNGTTTATSPQIFEVENGPVITQLTPNKGEAGSTVKLIGYNFSTTASNNKVLFGSIDAGLPIVNPNGTELEVTVPPGLSVGKHTVRLTVGGTTVTAPEKYEVIKIFIGVEEEVNYNSMKVSSKDGLLAVKINAAYYLNNTRLNVIDLKGTTVYSEDLNTNGELEYETQISSELTPGIYIVSIQENGEPIMSEKVLITD
tara:strand:+ start:32237 stop:34390 length:2154 start_codon:yes stop_codon:yes gene_type:complete